MQHEFDNTIDALLRDAARTGETVLRDPAAVQEFHFEAEDIAAFAENALPPKTRARFAAHFADCADCRQILTNFALISEAEQSTIFAAENNRIGAQTAPVVAAKTSWRERFAGLFTIPQLGYAMAGLAVLLIGSFAFVALRSSNEQTVSVAKFESEKIEKAAKEKPPPPAQLAPRNNESEERETAAANTPTPEDSVTPTPEDFSNQNAQSPPPEEILPPSMRGTIAQANRAAAPEQQSRRASNESARDESARSTNASSNAAATNAQPKPNTLTEPSATQTARTDSDDADAEQKRKRAEAEKQIIAENADKPAADSSAGQPPATLSSRRAAPVSGAPAAESVAATRIVGGKTFYKRGAAWVDSAFGLQATENIARGSDAYKKLPAGLRSIAANLNGEVIVVYAGKAYRIR